MVEHQRYPEVGLLDFQRPFAGKTLLIELEIGGFLLSLLNAGDNYRPNPAIGFMVSTTPEEVRRLFTALSAEGRVITELGEYPFSPLVGGVEDKFGVCWQLVARAEHTPADYPYVTTSLYFSGAAQNRAAEAVDRYVDVFPYSDQGRRVTHAQMGAPVGAGHEPLNEDSLVFAQFRLAGQFFTAMDAAREEDFTFDGGIALQYRAHGQDELDRVWDALSAYPEFERCGWLKDQFGVSWEIVPDNLGELMARPGSYEKLMQMGKIVVDEF